MAALMPSFRRPKIFPPVNQARTFPHHTSISRLTCEDLTLRRQTLIIQSTFFEL
jgi:hypothetical protein